MLTDYVSCNKLNNKSTHTPLSKKRKIQQNLRIVKFSLLLKMLGYSNIGVPWFQKGKK